ncbi:hypothetical protein V2J09_005034 [Rumex salicifolius]
MNHFVPEFDMDEYYSISSSIGPSRQKNKQDDEIFELLWQNGQVVVQSQNPRLQTKSSPPPMKFPPEDELMSWLQFPLVDPPFERELTDAFCFPPPCPPPPPLHNRLNQAPIRPEAPVAEVNFSYLSKTAARFPESGPSISSRSYEMRESMVDSSDTPANRRRKPNFSAVTKRAAEISDREIPCMSVSREVNTCDLTPTTSSPSKSGRGGSTADLMTSTPTDDRKRKGREPVDDANTEFQSEDKEIESYEPQKQSRGATTRRSRAAEVHNLSERRRRDRINEKMKTLQELIPRCSKTDKASTLDEAIEYLKSLQMQVQMMSMGCGMVPLMFPGVQQYMSSLGIGMGMGMNQQMEMGMNQQMMQFPNVLSGSTMPIPNQKTVQPSWQPVETEAKTMKSL